MQCNYLVVFGPSSLLDFKEPFPEVFFVCEDHYFLEVFGRIKNKSAVRGLAVFPTPRMPPPPPTASLLLSLFTVAGSSLAVELGRRESPVPGRRDFEKLPMSGLPLFICAAALCVICCACECVCECACESAFMGLDMYTYMYMYVYIHI